VIRLYFLRYSQKKFTFEIRSQKTLQGGFKCGWRPGTIKTGRNRKARRVGTKLKPLIMGFLIILYVAIVILMIAAGWMIYTKAGKPGWAYIIPIYNYIVMLEIVGKPWWWFLLLFIPIVNIVIAIWVTNLLSKSFGKDEGFTVGLILLPIIFFPILGFGTATYKGPAGAMLPPPGQGA